MTSHPAPPSLSLSPFRAPGKALLLAALLVGGCALDEDPPLLEESASELLSGEQVYGISNIYNSGGANGYVLSFASILDFDNMFVSSEYQAQFWPGGPWAAGSLGAAITYDGQPLPSIWATGFAPLPASSAAYTRAVDNMNALTAVLLNRTPYAAYFSLGSLVTSAVVQAQRSRGPYPESQRAWNLSISLLRDAITLANALCRPSTNVWRTAFNVQEMRELLVNAPSGPNWPYWGPWGSPPNASEYLRTRLLAIQANLGRVISNPATLESGVHGQGCVN
jgi:hypothetical protein